MGSGMISGKAKAAFETPVDDEEIGIPLDEPGQPVKIPEAEPEEEEVLTPA